MAYNRSGSLGYRMGVGVPSSGGIAPAVSRGRASRMDLICARALATTQSPSYRALLAEHLNRRVRGLAGMSCCGPCASGMGDEAGDLQAQASVLDQQAQALNDQADALQAADPVAAQTLRSQATMVSAQGSQLKSQAAALPPPTTFAQDVQSGTSTALSILNPVATSGINAFNLFSGRRPASRSTPTGGSWSTGAILGVVAGIFVLGGAALAVSSRRAPAPVQAVKRATRKANPFMWGRHHRRAA